MKERNKSFFLILLILVSFNLWGQKNLSADTAKSINVKPVVDLRVELLSIVFRLAGNPEYNSEDLKSYVAEINAHFNPYRAHPLIAFAKQIAEEKGIRYDAVMFMAIHLKQPPYLSPLVSFKQRVPEKRWKYEHAEKFVSLLQRFYREAKCEDFFNQHSPLYELAKSRFDNVFRKVDLNWYKAYYGKLPDAKFNVIIGLGNGGGNYGPHLVYPNGKEELYAILGTWSIDSIGMPVYEEESFMPFIIHEYNHSFINQLVEENANQLEAPGKKIYNKVREQMESMAYGNSKTMIDESLVRAAVVRYMKNHGTDSAKVQDLIHSERKSGFLWIEDVINVLEHYESNRDKYPTLQSFMPQIVKFYNQLALRIDSVKKHFEQNRPQVVSIEPFENNAQGVDTSISEMVINFDKPLNPKHFSIRLSEGGQEQMPITDLIGFTNNNKSLRLKIALKPNHEYSFVLGSQKFRTVDGYPLREYVVKFKTKK